MKNIMKYARYVNARYLQERYLSLLQSYNVYCLLLFNRIERLSQHAMVLARPGAHAVISGFAGRRAHHKRGIQAHLPSRLDLVLNAIQQHKAGAPPHIFKGYVHCG